MIRKVFFIFVATITLIAGMSLTASAQETADTFDYKAYADTYPDLKAVYGYDANALFAHYINFGKAEGRIGIFAGDAGATTVGAAAPAPTTSSTFSLNTISLGGDTYTLPCPVAEFLKNGWAIDYSYPHYYTFRYATRGIECNCILRKGNEVFVTSAASPYLNKKVPMEQGLIVGYQAVRLEEFPASSLTFCGGITLNSIKEDVEAILPSTFEKRTYNSDMFTLLETGYANRKEPITQYSNWTSAFVEGRDDFLITIIFNERQNTVRSISCDWQDREYEATIDWDALGPIYNPMRKQ